MSAAVAGALSAAAAVLLAVPWRPRPSRSPAGTSDEPPSRPGPVDRLGTALARRTRTAEDPATVRLLAWGAIGGVAALPLAPVLTLALPAGAWALTVLRQRQHARREDRAVLSRLPDTVDLLLLATSAGTGLALAHQAVAERVDGPVGAALLVAHEQAGRGTPRADAIVSALAPLGERPAALAHVLADHLRYGTPLGPELDRLGLELRLHRRRQAEEDARRVPVRLLAPLVACTLPAFALLTVAPLLIASLQQIPA